MPRKNYPIIILSLSFIIIHYYIMNDLKPGFSGFNPKDAATLDYHMNTSELPVNQFTAIGTGINRWQYLFFDPQKNSIEPFERIGQNSVLPFLDDQEHHCLPVYKQASSIQGQIKEYNR